MWYVSLILSLGGQKETGLCEFEANVVYIASSRPALQGYRFYLLKKKECEQIPQNSQSVSPQLPTVQI